MKAVLGLVLPLSLCSFALQAEDINITPYIVGGEPVNVAEYPFMASLMFEYESQPGVIYPFCGGSILDSTHILTAAHCVYDVASYRIRNMKVAIEANNAQEMFAVQRVSVKNIYYPRDYNNSTLLNDVAVLELSEPLPTYSTNHKVKLSDLSEQGYRSANEKFTIIGYGRLDSNIQNADLDFLKAEVEYVNPLDCDVWTNFTTSDKQICTKGSSFDDSNLVTATCQGDSGGPLVWDNNGVKTQIGIVSFGPSICGQPNQSNGDPLAAQSVFTDVSQYADWIRKAQSGEIAATRTATDLSDSSGGTLGFGSLLSLALFSLYRRKYS
ncbi:MULTISPECIES: S1 family peptidase [Aliivibrio]|uniref:Serine protease n=1 Tax=Aliivibrio finisterrensis TaxID=511998 RepID=A0A4Q5KWX3_9GAMM|nr:MULTISPECIES: serine protease [Aliivibrio]MDD9178107.1 serine protease [Aliivibrio sp. A6]RYU53608.1 serine protease [Aliivibrio finisterrensis]RYU54272.1 serine protease [Aliivibrio finisterrensis]RYU59252.1 serine protease [Aliivibrio finisterrensis]RYU66053.1 serine protease [Aliivibrio finisterrensis]